MRRRLLVPLAALLMAAPLAAQDSVPMPEAYRAVQLRKLQLQRRAILAMADSMPDSLYADRTTPPQRSFAEQLLHAAGAALYIARQVHPDADVMGPDSAATAAAMHGNEGMRAFVNQVYDAAEAILAAETPQQRVASVTLFGNTMPLWQVWDEVHQHTFWTLGQVVANFRMHGMAPPGFGFF